MTKSAYPESWAKVSVVDNSECPNISGTYWNFGICTSSVCESIYLNDKFSLNNLKGDESITIKQLSKELIEISFSTEGSQSKQLDSSLGQFECKDGAVWIGQGEYFAAEGVGIAKAKYKIGFRTAVDGSLIGQHRTFSYGLLMWFIPVGGTQTLWYQWDLYN